jgi:transcription-repair coupling factor (superfamily II helicase)
MIPTDLPGLYSARQISFYAPTPLEQRTGGEAIHLTGLTGSAASLFAATHHQQNSSPQVFILPDEESASFFLDDLENLLGEKKAFLFPSSFRNRHNVFEKDNASILLRAEVLTELSRNGSRAFVITHPEAVCEQVVSPAQLEQNTISLSREDKISIEFLTEFLHEHGFEHSDFVYDAGQFSVRGGIVDVWSFSSELPFRIEFNGDMVESVRTFEPADQLSVQPMHRITILPDVNKNLPAQKLISFFDFIPPSAIVWMKNGALSLNSVNEYIRQFSQVENSEEEKILFSTSEEIETKLKVFSVVEWGTGFLFKTGNKISFDTTPQPSFNKNFNLLIEALSDNTKNGYTNIILADNPKQQERILSIIEDVQKKRHGTGTGNAETHYDLSLQVVRCSLHEGFIDHELKLAFFTDHQIFDRYHRYRGRKIYSRNEAITLKELYALKPGDFVTHIDHGVGKFAGLETIDVNGKPQEAVRLYYKDNDILYVSIHSLHRIARYTGKEGTIPPLHKLGTNSWSNLKLRTKKKVKDIARDLIKLYAKRKTQKGFAFQPDTYLQSELEASFIYEDTPDQVKATFDFKKDMEQSVPMDRLICGDVGFGKTEIAIRAAFKAVTDGKQVAVLVPTTILALQHYKTFRERLKDFPCVVDYISRFKTSVQQKETLHELSEGKIDIIIGTHRLLGKDLKFKDLGLLIVDEEQKFGVTAKEKIKALRVNVDTLTLTATPIPRTLQFSLMGARDLSIINTPPPNRYPVTTEMHIFNESIIKEAILKEAARGGQVFFVHNRVKDILDIEDLIRKLCPGIRIAVGHGQLDNAELEKTMLAFIEGEYDVLLSTTIIESGLDIPNANTIIINQAQNFGLSDLHQLRGRVGRSNKKAFCYLLTPPHSVLTSEARQRLRAVEEFSDLGSGFNIAMRDLDIRGAGNLLGAEQSGFIAEIGYEMFHKILDEAVLELKESDFKNLFAEELKQKPFVSDCQIDTDLEIMLPSDYVNSITERLSLYKELDDIETEDALTNFESALVDRFGTIPPPAKELLNVIRLRWLAEKLGIEKLVLKSRKMICYFVSNPDSAYYQSKEFSAMVDFVKNNPDCSLKEDKQKLTLSVKNIAEVKNALDVLSRMSMKTSKEVQV